MKLKEKIEANTGGVLDIFMSSDGQSIPLGVNWIHKIEEGLQKAKIMFVFVTENSISSGWIYFEAGFAYSKGIQVIPVGIGIDIGSLKSPLNMLQGFNIVSGDSLNNFTSIINQAFTYNFSESFQEADYIEMSQGMRYPSASETDFGEIIGFAEYELASEYSTTDGETVRYDVGGFFENIKTFLEQHGIQY